MTEAVVLAIPKVLNTVCLAEGGKFTSRFVASLSPLLFFWDHLKVTDSTWRFAVAILMYLSEHK